MASPQFWLYTYLLMLSAARIHPAQWQLFKALRLAALQDAPYAFGSTHAEAAKRLDSEWQEMAADRAFSADACLFLVFDDDVPVGLAGAYRDERAQMQLVSVWIAPPHRGGGAATMVVDAVCGWAASQGEESIIAWVTDGNERALRFYKRLGFHDTGQRAPYPNDPTILEIETVRRLSD